MHVAFVEMSMGWVVIVSSTMGVSIEGASIGEALTIAVVLVAIDSSVLRVGWLIEENVESSCGRASVNAGVSARGDTSIIDAGIPSDTATTFFLINCRNPATGFFGCADSVNCKKIIL